MTIDWEMTKRALSDYTTTPASTKRMTPGYKLSSVVIHAVGPCCSAGYPSHWVLKKVDATPVLKTTYDTVLKNADQYVQARRNKTYPSSDIWPSNEKGPLENQGGKGKALDKKIEDGGTLSIALPAISMGLFGYPPGHGIPIALLSVLEYINKHEGNPSIKEFHFALRGEHRQIFTEQLTKIAEELNEPPPKPEPDQGKE